MMDRSFDLPRLGAAGGWTSGGTQVRRQRRRRAPLLPIGSRLQGCGKNDRSRLSGGRISTTMAPAMDSCAEIMTFTPSAITAERISISMARRCQTGRLPTATSAAYSVRLSRTASTSTAAQTDRLSNTFVISTLPTIWDPADAGRVGRYYCSDLPFLGLWVPEYCRSRAPHSSTRLRRGNLADLAFTIPAFLGGDPGTSSDDHPHNDIRAGERSSTEFIPRSRRVQPGSARCSSSITTNGADSSITFRHQFDRSPQTRPL
jgi:hypothetical protein